MDSTKPKGAKNQFANKLSRYSAVTVGGVAGTMAAFESSEGAMIVTNTLITLTDNTLTSPQADINLNGINGPASLLDGTNDVKVTVLTASMLSAQGLGGGLLGGMNGTGGFFYPTAFQAPSTIGSALGFGAGSTTPASLNSFGTLVGPGSAFGNWVGGTDAYIGIQFQINSNDHFGWVHVVWDPSTDTATIDQYAYNGVAGAPAIVPEPSALTLLGLGVFGLAARRRRKVS